MQESSTNPLSLFEKSYGLLNNIVVHNSFCIVNFYTKIFDIFCAYVDHKLVFRLGLFLL